MSYFKQLDDLARQPMMENWGSAFDLLQRYDKTLSCLSNTGDSSSVFELALNLQYEDSRANLWRAFAVAAQECAGDFWGHWASTVPYALMAFVFRNFFENGNGADLYKPSSKVFGSECTPSDVRGALMKAWPQVFPSDMDDIRQQGTGIPRDVFCSRCWLIKNFQNREGHSNLCYAIRAFKDINDRVLRLRPDRYLKRSNGTDGCESHLNRLLTDSGCDRERAFISDFVDYGIADDVRFGWFKLLDAASQAVVGNLINVVWHKGALCFAVNEAYEFLACDDAVDTIKVKLFLCKDQSATYCFKKRGRNGFMLEGATSVSPQPVWKVRSIVKFEYDSVSRREYRREDVLEGMLAGSYLPSGYGVFLVSEDHAQKGVYLPFARRRLPVGKYSAYAYKRFADVNLRVIYDKTNVQVNGIPLQGRTFEVADENGEVVISTYGNAFSFGVNRRTPLRETENRELCISHTDPRQVFVARDRWPLPGVDAGSWSYEVGGTVFRAIGSEQLYKSGTLMFSCNGVSYEESAVTFVDFRSKAVFAYFPTLGVGETGRVTVYGCGAMDGTYEIGAGQTTLSKTLPGGQWSLNIPVVREGLVFRTEDGEEVVTCPFKDGPDASVWEIAIEDFKRSTCISCCAPSYERAVISRIKYLDGREIEVSIPLLKDIAGFSFAKSRAYLAGRAGVDGDLRMRDILSDLQVVDWLEVVEVPSSGSQAGERRCKIKLYDPKRLPVIERSLANGLITIRIYAAYCSHAVKKVMRWLPSDRMDVQGGVKTFGNWRPNYPQYRREPSGRWTASFEARSMNSEQELARTLGRGAVVLAFIGEDGRDLISGGFCLFDAHSEGLTVRGGDWECRLAMSMHKRYGRNEDDLCTLLQIYSLKWGNCNDYSVVSGLRRGVRSQLANLRRNIAGLGRGADLYMNSLYNVRDDQWSGYAYLAGWYFVERAVEEINASEEGTLALNDCMCFHSSTGLRIWHPLMMTKFSIAMADAINGKNIWKKYCRSSDVSIAEVSDGIAEVGEAAPWYRTEIVASLDPVNIDLSLRGIVAAAQDLVETLVRWRALAVFKTGLEEETERQNAADLMDLTQRLRNCLLALESSDERMRATAIEQADRPLFCDLVRMIDAKYWN